VEYVGSFGKPDTEEKSADVSLPSVAPADEAKKDDSIEKGLSGLR
jgi:hypothetical protein